MPYTFVNESDMPISVSALRDHCRIVGNDFDTQLTRAYTAAARDIEVRAGILLRPCAVSESRKGLRGVQGHVLSVGPIDASSVVIQQAGSTVTGWEIDVNAAVPTLCITDRGLFKEDLIYDITYTAGFTKLPYDLNIALLELTAHHFENREATSELNLKPVPSSVWSIVQNYGNAKV